MGNIIMTRKRNLLCTGLCTATLLLAATGAMAGKVERTPNTSDTGGQLNRCWGEIASKLAQLDTAGTTANGGAMGQHSRDNSGQGTTFRENTLDNGRLGIGNGTADVNGPHAAAPGDGGLGQHAINNGSTQTGAEIVIKIPGTDQVVFESEAGFSNIQNPMTGAFGPQPDFGLTCSLDPTIP
jgi:hypothetical protein